jgi:hypothetical protein
VLGVTDLLFHEFDDGIEADVAGEGEVLVQLQLFKEFVDVHLMGLSNYV